MRHILGLILLLFVGVMQAKSPEPQVVVSVRPLYGIAVNILDGITEPKLLIDSRISPHHFQMAPSEARKLEQADLLVYISSEFESFIQTKRYLNKSLILENVPGIKLLPLRDHQDHHHHGHHHGPVDLHLWLLPHNMKAYASALARRLVAMLPDEEKKVMQNLRKVLKELDGLTKSLKQKKTIKYVAHHDALQYLEKPLSLELVGVASPDVDYGLSGHHLNKLHQQIKTKKPHCLLVEDVLDGRVVQRLASQWQLPVVPVDVLGMDIQLSKTHYSELMKGLKEKVQGCHP